MELWVLGAAFIKQIRSRTLGLGVRVSRSSRENNGSSSVDAGLMLEEGVMDGF